MSESRPRGASTGGPPPRWASATATPGWSSRRGWPARPRGEKLPALVGPAWAAEILFSARRFSDAEALRMGLVNRVVPADELEGAVRELAGQMAANAPLTIRACKAAIHEV